MSNFWDSIGQSKLNNRANSKPNLMQFIMQNKGKTLDQMAVEYGLNITQDDINRILPEANKLLNSLSSLGLK